MCKNCSNCKCKDSAKKDWIREYENLPESKKSTTLDAQGVYNQVMARKQRELEKEIRNQWR